IELLSSPSAAPSRSDPNEPSKLISPCAVAASIRFDLSSQISALISRTVSDSRCVILRPSKTPFKALSKKLSGAITSMPFLKLPPHNRPCSPKARAEIILLVNAPGVCSPNREIRGVPESLSSCQLTRQTPSLLVNQIVSPIGWLSLAKAVSWQDERLSGRF